MTETVLRALTSALSLPETLANLYEALKERLPIDGIFANIALTQPDRIQFLASVDERGAVRREDSIVLPKSISALRSMSSHPITRVNRLEEDPFTAWVAPQIVPDIASFIMVRCRVEGRHFGIVCFWSKTPCAFTEAHRALLEPFRNALSLNMGFAVASRLKTEVDVMQKEAEKLRAQIDAQAWEPLTELLARTPSFERIAGEIRRVAPYDATVLITGDSGTGKEVVATVIQQIGPRSRRPFVKLNCAAVTPSLIESELFGWERGAFTGAVSRHAGLFEQADGGTLFLDEVGELTPDMQVKLLRVLQQQSFRRVGGTQEIAVNVRIIAATNRPLRQLVESGQFRLDLFYRLAVVPIHIPPLSQRPEDLEPLAKYFLQQLARKYGISPIPQLSEAALRQARRHPWLGNVREWRNVLARAVLSGQNPIEVLDFDGDWQGSMLSPDPQLVPSTRNVSSATSMPHGNEMRDFEAMQRDYFRAILTQCKGKISGPGGAAEIARLHPNTLRSRLATLGLLPSAKAQ